MNPESRALDNYSGVVNFTDGGCERHPESFKVYDNNNNLLCDCYQCWDNHRRAEAEANAPSVIYTTTNIDEGNWLEMKPGISMPLSSLNPVLAERAKAGPVKLKITIEEDKR